MGELQPAVRQAIEDEAALFCRVTQAYQRDKGAVSRVFADESLQARTSNCGIATAFMQQRLREQYDFDTERMYAEPPLAPRSQYNGHITGHMLLRHESTLIDPTYGQFFSYVGMRAGQEAVDASAYPDNLALLVSETHPDEALEPLAAAMLATSELEHVARSEYQPLRGLGRQAILCVLRDIYTSDHYEPRELKPEDGLYDWTTELVRMAAHLR